MAIRKLAFAAGASLILIGPFLIYWWTSKAALAWLAFFAAAAFTILTRIDDLAEFSLGPLKARMRETLAEATATVEQLREVATAASRVVLTDLMAGNFFDSMTLRKRLDLHDEVMRTLNTIGASEAQKSTAELEWRKGIGVTYHRAIRNAISEDQRLDPARKQLILQEFDSSLQYDEWQVSTPDKMEQLFIEKGYLPDDIKRWIDDYRYYLENNRLRNREAFVKQ